MRKQVTTLQNEKRLRFLGIANILVGVLTAFSALFNFMFYLLQADGDLSRCLIEGGFASVAALLGFLNGFSLLNPRKKAARPLTVSFGIALLIFMIVLAIEGQFNPWPSMIPTTYSLFLIVVSFLPIWKATKKEETTPNHTDIEV